MECDGINKISAEKTIINDSGEQTNVTNVSDISAALPHNNIVKTANASIQPTTSVQLCSKIDEKHPDTIKNPRTSYDKTVNADSNSQLLISNSKQSTNIVLTSQKLEENRGAVTNGTAANKAGPSTCKSPDPFRILAVETLAEDDPVVLKAHSLAIYIVNSVTNDEVSKPNDKIEETLLRCVKHLLTKHELLFRSMMKRLKINNETGYSTFVGVANELFENEKRNITWGRIIALFAFGGQLALYSKENKLADFGKNISLYMGKDVADMAGSFVKKNGGWVSIFCCS